MVSIHGATKKHRHVAIKSKKTFYMGPVSHRPNYQAQDGSSHIETCKCGAQRRINRNNGVTETGAWLEPGDISSLLNGKTRGFDL